MSLPNNAISQKCIILSVDDARIEKLKYRAGDKFYLKDNSLELIDPSLLNEIGTQRIFIVDSILLDKDGELVYRLSIDAKKLAWVVDEKYINKAFTYIKNSSTLRLFQLE